MGKALELTGFTSGRLKVIGLDTDKNASLKDRFRSGELKSRPPLYWICRCECGSITSIPASRISNSEIQSCGCYSREVSRANVYKNLCKANTYETTGDVTIGYSSSGEYSFSFDTVYCDVVKVYMWYRDAKGYWCARKRDGSGKSIKLHQLIMMQIDESYTPSIKSIPDHIDRDPSNNKRDNLRLVCAIQNARNHSRHKSNTSGKMGVGKDGSSWRARIIDNNGNNIGKSFKTFDDAVNQRIAWEKQFGYLSE